jgi:penicillin-binding protein 2
MFDRAVQMALPPGSVFKTLTAIALLHSAGYDPRQQFECQGYLHTPERQRCAIYRRWGMRHGPVTLADALARSCNVYFFHWAEQVGPGPIVDWAERFGFGTPAGIDLPGEVAGHLPTGDIKKTDPTELAIGQETLTVTPLQVVRMMAAVANGGKLVTPHVVADAVAEKVSGTKSALATEGNSNVEDLVPDTFSFPTFSFPPRPIRGIDPARLAILREGLRRVATDPEGTGYEAFHALGVDVAAKTGTAETGGGAPEHAWFAGYAPVDAPQLAFVVVLEHAGDASATAAPAAASLVEKLQSAGYFGPGKVRLGGP